METGRDGIRCWLKDENTVTIDPILTNAIGGIKVMVDSGRRKAPVLRVLQNQDRAMSLSQMRFVEQRVRINSPQSS